MLSTFLPLRSFTSIFAIFNILGVFAGFTTIGS
jgi:hypothetical protein